MAWGGRRPSPLVIAALMSAALGVASLELPSGPTYDPYAWLVWGREIAHLDLSTASSGTSWKPLPSLIDALLSPLGGALPGAWLVIARGGAIFAVFMAARLAWRLAPHRLRGLAAITASASLVLTHEWLRRNGVGDAEGLMTALGLLAVDRHLDGRQGHAFAYLVVAGLIRVEMWPFCLLYGAWLWLRGRARLRVALGLASLPVLWLGGDWIGSGHLTTAAGRARHPVAHSPGASAHPVLAVLGEAFGMLPLPAWIALGAALLVALVGRQRVALTIAACAAAWTAIVAAMAAKGYPGLPRFLFMASALEAVLAGIGCACVVGLLARNRRAVALAATGLVCAAFAFGAVDDARRLPADVAAVDRVADVDAALAESVADAGGARSVLRCGMPVTRWYTVTALAWDLDVGAGRVHDKAASGRPEVFAPERGTWDVRPRGCPALS
jgi:hypothetical protein